MPIGAYLLPSKLQKIRDAPMPKSIFRGIYDNIRESIETGLYTYQSMLLSENELCARYGCSRSSVRRALSELARDGYVQPIQGKGVRVIWRPETDDDNGGYSMGGLESFNQTARRIGFTPSTTLLEFRTLTIDAALAQTTGFAEGDEVYFTKRIRSADGVAVSIESSWMLAAEAPGLTAEQARVSLYGYLEKIGVTIGIGKRLITLEAANEEDIRVFGLTSLKAVGVFRGQHFDSKGVMFEYSEIRQHPYYFAVRETATRPERS